jgi:hypothetical protein
MFSEALVAHVPSCNFIAMAVLFAVVCSFTFGEKANMFPREMWVHLHVMDLGTNVSIVFCLRMGRVRATC